MTIDLRTCRPGQKLLLRNGQVVRYLKGGSDSTFHTVRIEGTGRTKPYYYTGEFYTGQKHPRDIVEIVPFAPVIRKSAPAA